MGFGWLWLSGITEFIVESIEKGDIELDEENSETPLYGKSNSSSRN